MLSIAAGGFNEALYNDDDDGGFDLSKILERVDIKADNTMKTRLLSGKSETKTSNNRGARSARSANKKTTSKLPLSARSKLSSSAAVDDDVMPEAATEMGFEAQVRFLKAKVRVLQEEVNTANTALRVETEGHGKLKAALKTVQEEADKSKKTLQAQQSQLQKVKLQLEEEKKKSEAKALQAQGALKELESLKRERKQSATNQSATEVRLNRALEELDKVKSQLQKEKQSGKESSDKSLKQVESVRNENKRLEKIKGDTLMVMKKQQKLIGILKKQIMHIEAAKLLSFTEEEFVKALDWENSVTK